METTQHPAALAIPLDPLPTHDILDILQVNAVTPPQLRLATTADCGQQVTPILRRRIILLGKAFGHVRTDRFRRPAELIRQRELLDPRQPQACPMQLKRQPICPPKDLKVFDPLYRSVSLAHRTSWNLVPGSWFLKPAASVRGLSPVTFSARGGC
jgi:hypothetical protein